MRVNTLRELLPLVALTSVAATAYPTITPVLPDLARELAVAETAAGVLQGAVALPGVALAPLLGAVSDTVGRRRVALGGLLVFAGAGTACALAPTFAVLLGLRLLQGVGYAALVSLVPALLGDRFDGDDRRRAIALNSFSLTATSALAPVLGGLLALAGPRAPFLLFAAGFALLPVAARALPVQAPVPRVPARAELRAVAPVLALTAATMVTLTAVTAGSLPFTLDRRFAVGVAWRGILLALPNVGSATASTYLASRLAGRRTTAVGLLLLLSGAAAVVAAPALWVAAAGAVTMGLGVGGVYNTTQHRVASADEAARGAVVGAWAGTVRLGQVLGPILGTRFLT